MSAVAGDLRHGVTIAHATSLARLAAATHFTAPRASGVLGRADREDTARYAIVTAVLEAGERPADTDLLHAGRDAISRAVTAELHHHGLSARSREHPGPGFARYWHPGRQPDCPWEAALVEGIALGQVWAVLPARHCRVLRALADCGGYQAAARSLGTTDATFRVRVSKARAAFRAWWFEHETPPSMWGADRRTGGERARAVTHVIRARARDRQAAKEGEAA